MQRVGISSKSEQLHLKCELNTALTTKSYNKWCALDENQPIKCCNYRLIFFLGEKWCRTWATTCTRTRRGRSCWGRRSSTWCRWSRSSRRPRARSPVWGRRSRPRTRRPRCCRRCIRSCWSQTPRVSWAVKIYASSLCSAAEWGEKRSGVKKRLPPSPLSQSLCADINPSSVVEWTNATHHQY